MIDSIVFRIYLNNNLSSYHFEFIKIHNHEYDIIYEKWARHIFLELKILIHKLICVNCFSPQPTDIKMKTLQWATIFSNVNGYDNFINFKNEDVRA